MNAGYQYMYVGKKSWTENCVSSPDDWLKMSLRKDITEGADYLLVPLEAWYYPLITPWEGTCSRTGSAAGPRLDSSLSAERAVLLWIKLR